MKKEWQAPELEILIFSIQDVVSESPPDPGYYGTDWM